MNNNKSSEYYIQASRLLKRFQAEIDFHIKMGALYKSLYEAADKYGDQYKIIKKWALRKNEKHCQLGSILSEQALSLCVNSTINLTQFIEKEDT